jgi:hypothetical protein
MSERKYLPTVGDLVDRMFISLMKSIFIDRETYRKEMFLIWDDLLSMQLPPVIYPVLVLALVNHEIWVNESIARKTGKGGRLRYTHSLNGVRSKAKNQINKLYGERVDEKIDCLAADLPLEMGNWRVFE